MGDPTALAVFSPAQIGRLRLRNRFIRSAALEGLCPRGVPTEALVRHHEQLAAGGVGMTTVAYAAVTNSGRGYPHQLCIWRPGTLSGLRRLTDAVHAQGAGASLQLAHAGYCADPKLTGGTTMAPSAVFNRFTRTFPRPMTETDISAITEEFGRAATTAVEAGFDAVEIHAAHGYLLSQFISPYTNRRRDQWGGSLEARLRFPVAVIRRVRERVGPAFPILVKMNVRDGFAGGLEPDEAVQVARRFEDEGVDALVLSGGFMSRTPMAVMRGDVPYRELRRSLNGLLTKLAALAVARLLVRPVPFTEAYFWPDACRVRKAVSIPLVLVGGLRTLARIEDIVREGIQFIAMARPFFAEPDLVRKFETGAAKASRCEPCNRCLAALAAGEAKCPVFEAKS
jgi:2,4-dienoyl-CoA reductase-like NADH-dependent reductase (Old Yellow Enzyme family)